MTKITRQQYKEAYAYTKQISRLFKRHQNEMEIEEKNTIVGLAFKAFGQTAWRNALESMLSGIYDDHNGWLNQSRRSIWLEKRNSLGLPDTWPELPF